jgi:hypothetical protein
MRALLFLLRVPANADVFDHYHQVPHLAAIIRNRRDMGPNPNVRCIRQHEASLGDDAFSCLAQMNKVLTQLIEIIGSNEVFHAQLQQLRRWALHNLAKPPIDLLKAPARVGFGDANHSLAEHTAQTLFLPAQPRFEPKPPPHVRADCETEDARADDKSCDKQQSVPGVAADEWASIPESAPSREAAENKDGHGGVVLIRAMRAP